MADTVKSSSDLKMVWGFYDGDDRTESLPNPREDLTVADIKAAAAVAITNNAFIGDKTGAALVSLKSAKKVEVTRTKLDLANN